MKKLLYSILALVGVVTTSCEQENIEVVYKPENVTAAQILDVKAGNIADGVKTEVIYTDVNYNMNVSNPIYTLYIAKSGTEMAGKQKLSADFANPTDNQDGSKSVTIDATTINNILTKKLEAEFGQEISVDFQIETSVSNEKGNAVAGSEICSNIVTVSYTPVEIKEALPDAEEFDKVWVIGDYCGWNHGATQFLFDYAASGNVYSGVIDFGGKAANGFKLTGVAKWDDTCNWGLEDNTTAEAEASSLQLITGGGSQDIKCYSKRFYKFSFDKTSMVLTKEFGFDSVGVVGAGGDWNNDIAMEFNPVYCRFYVDVTFVEGDKFKCRADGEWNLNWGATSFGLVGDNDGNFIAEAGNYRVYLNLNKGTFELNADMYGKQEPGVGGGTTPEPEPEPTETTYGLIGQFNGWGEPDVDLVARGDGWYVVKEVVIPAAEENKFLIRLNDAWSNKFGFAEDNTFVTIDAKNTLTAEGKDMWIADGTYDFYFNPTSAELYVMTAGAADPTLPQEAKPVKFYADVTATGWTNCNIYGWGDLGEYAGGWPGSALSTENVDGKEYYAYTFDASAWGKTINVIFNNGTEQTVNIENIVLDKDYIFTLTEKDGAGKWLANINGEAPVTPEPEPEPAVKEYGLVGSLTEWGTTGIPDIKFTDAGNGCYTLMGQTLTTNDSFKVRLYGVWDDSENYGLATAGTVNINEAITLITSGGSGDMKVAVDDTYDLYFYPAALTLYVMTQGTAPEVNPSPEPTDDVWGLMGTFVDNNWTSDVWFNAEGNYLVAKGVAFAQATSEFKVRKNQSWADPDCFGTVDGGTYNVGDAIQLGATANGSGNNVKVNVDTTKAYDVYFYLETLTLYVMTEGTAPEITTPAVQYGLVGEFNGWGGSSDILFTDYQNGFLAVTNVDLEAGKGFKVRFYNDGTWNSEGDYALERGASTVIGEAMTLKHGGDSDNLSVPTTGTYDIYFNPTTCVMYVMVAGEVPAI